MNTAGRWLVDIDRRKPRNDDWLFEGDNSKRTIGTTTTEEMSSNSLGEGGWSLNSMAPCDGFNAMNDSFLVAEGRWWDDDDDDNVFGESPVFATVTRERQREERGIKKSKSQVTAQEGRVASPTRRRRSMDMASPVDPTALKATGRPSRDSGSKSKRTQKTKKSSKESGSPRRSRSHEDGEEKQGPRHRSSSCHAGERDRRPSSPRKQRSLEDKQSPQSPVRTRSRTSSATPRSSDRPASPRKSRSDQSPKHTERRDRLYLEERDEAPSPQKSSSKTDASQRSRKSSATLSPRREKSAVDVSIDEETRPRRTKRHTTRRQSINMTATVDAPRAQRNRRASMGGRFQ